jgi:hypothetical protein
MLDEHQPGEVNILSSDIGVRWAIALMHRAFGELAIDFAAHDRQAAFTALSRIELLIADELAAFREFYPERDGIEIVDATLAAVLDEIGSFIEESREAVKRGRTDPE